MTAFDEIQKAKSLIASNKRIEARQVLSALVQAEPSNAQAWFLLSHVVDSRDQAIYCLERAVKIDPLNPEIRERLNGFQKPAPIAAPVNIPALPIYSIIIILTVLVLIWLAIALVQLWIPLMYPETTGSASVCITGLWNLFATGVNAYLLFQVTQKKKTAVRTLYILAVVGTIFGAFQLLASSAFVQLCAIPLYIGLGFFAYVEKDKFIN